MLVPEGSKVPKLPLDLCALYRVFPQQPGQGGQASFCPGLHKPEISVSWAILLPVDVNRETPSLLCRGRLGENRECGHWNQASPFVCLSVSSEYDSCGQDSKCHLCSAWTHGLCITSPPAKLPKSKASPAVAEPGPVGMENWELGRELPHMLMSS